MGKCVSKQPSFVTIALSEKDLANANQIWSKFAENVGEAIETEAGEPTRTSTQREDEDEDGDASGRIKRGNQLWEHKSDNFVSAMATDGVGKLQQHQEAQQNKNNNATNISCQYSHIAKATKTPQAASTPATPSAKAKAFPQQRQPQGLITSKSKHHDDDIAVAMMHIDVATYSVVVANDNDNANVASIQGDAALDDRRWQHKQHKYLNNKIDIDVADVDDDVVGNGNDVYDHGDVLLPFERTNNVAIANDGPECACHTAFGNCTPNFSQNDGQLCLAHLHLLQHWPTAANNNNNNNNTNSIDEAGTINVSRNHRACNDQDTNNNKNNHSECPQTASRKNMKNVHHDINNASHSNNNRNSNNNNNKSHQVNSDAGFVGEVFISKSLNSNEVNYDECTDFGACAEGQIESKKSLKKHGANAASIETKGTAMSFGFRKKLNSTPKKLKKLIEGSVDFKSAKHDKCNNPRQINDDDNDERIAATVIETARDKGITTTTIGATTATTTAATQNIEHKDSNGNAPEIESSPQFKKMGRTTPSITPKPTATGNDAIAANSLGVNMQAHLPGVNNRFGYRGIIRPASTGGDSKDSNANINHNGNINGNATSGTTTPILISNLKRRSKSAHAGRALTSNQGDGGADANGAAATPPKINQTKTLTFNLSHNSTIEYQRQQFFQQPPPSSNNSYGSGYGYSNGNGNGYGSTSSVNGRFGSRSAQHNLITTGMHTNVIVRPTPRAPPATFSRFTLHTTSLPKPEFPIAISLSTTTTPTTPAGSAVGLFAPSAAKQQLQKQQQQHPLTAVTAAVAAQSNYQYYMDPKAAKHVANSTTRRGFNGSREISADSGISSIDMAMESSASSSCGRSASPPKRSRSRPRNLQMVMSGRHKFEVRDMDTDPNSSESSSIVIEPLALPKLPTDSQSAPLPLNGLIRSNTVLNRTSNESSKHKIENEIPKSKSHDARPLVHTVSDDSEGREEKLYLDRSTSEKNQGQQRDLNTNSSKTTSPSSSIMMSWRQSGGEALATQDNSLMESATIFDDSNKIFAHNDVKKASFNAIQLQLDLNDEDLNTISSDMNFSPMSSNYEPTPSARTFTLDPVEEVIKQKQHTPERPKLLCDENLFEKKFAEMALADGEFLIDDETSPTDSLVSSTASDEAGAVDKQNKHKFNEELQEKDIDEISPELEVLGSPISPGTPTHASRSLSLSDCGNLIDDEIADQPALLFNDGAGGAREQDGVESLMSRHDKTDTPTLMESISMRSSVKATAVGGVGTGIGVGIGSGTGAVLVTSKSRTPLQHAIELSLRTPVSLRKKVMERAESMDTLSPCESIGSDDLMMDFDMDSSVDSIDRAASQKSRSGSDLNKIDDAELFSELDKQDADLMKELDSMLLAHQQNRGREKSRVAAHLPARATRLLNRSRLQQHCNFNADSPDSAKSSNSLRRSANASSRASSNGSMHQHQHQHQHHQHKQPHQQHQQLHQHQQPEQFSPHMQRSSRVSLSSSDDLMLNDKSFRNAMIQDVLHFQKQLLRLRRILQETETTDPFDLENGQQPINGGLDADKDADIINLISTTNYEPNEDFSELRRQVVYLQTQIDERDRTIRQQRDLIDRLEAEKAAMPRGAQRALEVAKERINTATQTERTRPLTIGTESLTRTNPEYTSYTTHITETYNDSCAIIQHRAEKQQLQQQQHNNPQCNNNNDNSKNDKNYQINFNDCINWGINGIDDDNCNSKPVHQTRRHTIISTTLTNYNAQLSQIQQQQQQQQHQHQPSVTPASSDATTAVITPQRRASVAWDSTNNATTVKNAIQQYPTATAGAGVGVGGVKTAPVYKPVRITLIGDTLKQWQEELKALQNGNSKWPQATNDAATKNGKVINANTNEIIAGDSKIDLNNQISKSNGNVAQHLTKTKLQQLQTSTRTTTTAT